MIYNPCPLPGFPHDPVPALSQGSPMIHSPCPSQSSPMQIAHDTYWTQGRVARDHLDVLEQTNIVGPQESKERPAGLPLSYRSACPSAVSSMLR